MSNIGSYDERVKNFSWSIAEKELGYQPGDVINIGWYCTDRICQQGKGDKVALIWEGFTGAEKTYTYNDIRLASNTIAAFLSGLGIQPERARLPVHGPRPRALPRLPGHPQDRGHRPAALLRLRRRVALRPPVQRRDHGRHHPEEARPQGPQDPGQAAPPPAHHRRRPRRRRAPQGPRGRLLAREVRARRALRRPPDEGRVALGPPLHLGHDRACPRASSTSTTRSSRSTSRPSGSSTSATTTSTGARPIPAGSRAPPTASSPRSPWASPSASSTRASRPKPGTSSSRSAR